MFLVAKEAGGQVLVEPWFWHAANRVKRRGSGLRPKFESEEPAFDLKRKFCLMTGLGVLNLKSALSRIVLRGIRESLISIQPSGLLLTANYTIKHSSFVSP